MNLQIQSIHAGTQEYLIYSAAPLEWWLRNLIAATEINGFWSELIHLFATNPA